MSQKNQFDRVAPVYDGLSKLVFGSALINAQKKNLVNVPLSANVLVVGGGSGEILCDDLLNKVKHIDYVELSAKMLRKAKARCNSAKVNFIHADIAELTGSYDAVVANFFLDCFDAESLEDIILHLKSLMSPNAVLLVTDFKQPQMLWHKVLLASMLKFFKHASNLEAGKLQPIREKLKAAGFHEHYLSFGLRGFVFTAAFKLVNK
ncbi:class I SAM-dependent methyltransferase [Roseivirga pacifica]|uniref:class I SAM-dependent methyltransferase n=1 Tax=Roseivirga pacifica TaxID=1267423 RepID=UPI003BB0B9F7